MSFLAPWAIWFAAGIPVIVLLYLLKLKRRAVPVSTLMFWQKVLQESRRRAFFQKLRQLLSLLLHLLIFALILAALAKPVFDRAVREGSSTVLVLDTRARMEAREGNETRMELAKKLAANYLGQASASRQLALLTFDAAPRVVVPFSDDEQLLRQGLDQTAATQATGELAAAVRLAEQLLAARKGSTRIIVVSAAHPSEWPPARADLEMVSVGSTHDNVAITRFATRPLLANAQTSEVLLEVANFGREAANLNLELAIDSRPLDVRPLALAPGERKVQVFPTVPRAGASRRGWLTAKLDRDDALPSDNVAYAVLPTQTPRRVLLVRKGNWFLEKMLAADQGLQAELLAPDAFTLALAAKFDVVICDNALPAGFDLAQTPGNFLFIKQTPFAATAAGVLEQPLVSETDTRHPALRLVNLQNVTVVRATALAEPGALADWRFATPIRSFEHPLMITGERRTDAGPQRIAALALDITDSDLPLRVAFPLLMSNTVHWLAGGAAAAPLSLATGEALPLGEGETVWSKAQTSGTGPAQPPATELVSGLFQPLANGFYLMNQPGEARWMAVNTFSEAESDLSTGTPPGAAASTWRLGAVGFAGWPLWQYLAIAALLLFTAEWWLFHRRRTE
jgi:hypothetical protein